MSLLVFSLFFSIFCAVLTLMNFAVLKGLLLAFGGQLSLLPLVSLSIVLSLLFLGATIIARYYSGSAVTLFYMIISYWVGFALMCGFVFLFLLLPAAIWPGAKNLVFITGTCLALIASVYATVHALERKIKETIIPFRENLTLVQVSDVHYGVVNASKYLAELAQEINGLNPDAVFFTGDIVDGTTHLEKGSLLPLKQLKAPAYFVSGNHDFIDGLEEVYQAVEEAGITVLDNKTVEIKGSQIGGLSFTFKKVNLKEGLTALNFKNDRPKILLYHEPRGVKEIESAGVDLLLCGHTHGGQIIPFNILVRVLYPYMAGLYKIGNMQLFVSTGCGTWGPKMRLGTDSEINLLKLRKTEK